MTKKTTELGVGKKVLASALSAAMVVAFAPAVAMAEGTEDAQGSDVAAASDSGDTGDTQDAQVVAKIGDATYTSLQAAIDAVNAGETIVLAGNCSGSGLFIKENAWKNFTLDFQGYSYTVNSAVGNTGTITQAVHFEKNNTVCLKNGTLAVDQSISSSAKILLQNYANLTLDGMELDGSLLAYPQQDHYTLSNNNGKCTVKDTRIIASNDTTAKAFAFDVCRFSSYPSVKVTVEGDSVIDGNVEVSGTVGEGQSRELLINDGTFNGMLSVYGDVPANTSINGGTFTDIANAVKYAADTATLKMGANATASLTIPAGKNITLDLNGKKLTNAAGQHSIVNKGFLKVQGSGTVDNISDGKSAIYNIGTCNLAGGTFERSAETGVDKSTSGGNSSYTVLNHGNMTVAEGVVVNNKGHFSSLFENGYYSYSDSNDGVDEPVLTINGGVFDGGLNTVKNDDGAKLFVYNGTFKNYTQAAFQNHHVAEIHGGFFEAKDCAAVLQCGSCEANSTHDAHTLVIDGGSFIGALQNDTFGILKVSGGTFSINPVAFVNTSVKNVYKMLDGTYVVSSTAPAHTNGGNAYSGPVDGVYTEYIYSAPVTPVTPKPDPEPTPVPTPAAPGTNVSGTDASGNTVEATVTDNEKTTLPDGTDAAGSVEYKGTAGSGSSEPASSASIPASVTSSDGTVYAVTKIADDAFNGQSQLQSVSIPATVVEIGERAFAGTGLASVQLPAATSTIGKAAFKGCASLKTADISKAALTQIPADAFNGTSITSIDVPDSVKSIGARAFKGTKLKSLDSKATTIGASAFAGCKSLRKLTVPKARTVGASALKDASKLKALTTGTALEGIGSKALSGTQVKVVTVKSKKLTKKGVKNSLKGSKVTKVEVAVAGSEKVQDKYVSKYREMFKKSNSGKSVKVVKAKKTTK